jgi:hypothetical protein
MTYTSAKDSNNSGKNGELSEDRFELTIPEYRWNYRKATEDENKYQHWDFLLYWNLRGFRTEVKGMKRINRWDEDVQDKWLWIELHGIGEHNKGWLFGAESEILAFEIRSGFVLVYRKHLIELIRGLVNLNKLVSNPEDAKYCTYNRKNRSDLLTLIATADLKKIEYRYWKSSSPCLIGNSSI